MSIKKYHNEHTAALKDNVIQSVIPDNISECALYLQLDKSDTRDDTTCSTPQVVEKVGEIINSSERSSTAIIADAKEKLGCDTEKCVLESLSDKLGPSVVQREISTRFKITGPNGQELLSNVNIDDTLLQWTNQWKDFYPYNFNMANYAQQSLSNGSVVNSPDTLATVSFSDLYYGRVHKEGIPPPPNGYRCGACVINSDVYTGRGKHWMALFFDARGDNWSVEFFNSGGSAPDPRFINWILKTAASMKEVAKEINVKTNRNITVTTKHSSSIRHQHSKTECGLYSLFYIFKYHNSVF